MTATPTAYSLHTLRTGVSKSLDCPVHVLTNKTVHPAQFPRILIAALNHFFKKMEKRESLNRMWSVQTGLHRVRYIIPSLPCAAEVPWPCLKAVCHHASCNPKVGTDPKGERKPDFTLGLKGAFEKGSVGLACCSCACASAEEGPMHSASLASAWLVITALLPSGRLLFGDWEQVICVTEREKVIQRHVKHCARNNE